VHQNVSTGVTIFNFTLHCFISMSSSSFRYLCLPSYPYIYLPHHLCLTRHLYLIFISVSLPNFKGEAHRVGRLLSLFSSRPNWDSLTPLAAGESAPHLLVRRRGHTRLRKRGWGSPNYSDERTYTVVLYKYMYFVGKHIEQFGAHHQLIAH
jgi:hypothetical protein